MVWVRPDGKLELPVRPPFRYTRTMRQSISVKRKVLGRPATGVDPLVGVRLPPEMLTQLDQFARRAKISRSEALRRLIQSGLDGAKQRPPAKPSGKRKSAG